MVGESEMKRRVLMRRAVAALATIGIALAGCRTVADRMVTRSDAKAARNADTGVLLGAEERDIIPEHPRGAVLFVHGYVGAGNNFNQLPELVAAEGWHARVIRLPGHGTSPRDIKGTTADDCIAAVEEELAGLQAKYDDVVVVGHSMGGALGTIALAEKGAAGLVIGGGYFGVTNRWYYLMPAETWTRYGMPVLGWVYKGTLFMGIENDAVKDEIVSYTWVPARAAKNLLDVGERARSAELLSRVTCPVLALHSRDDIAASPKALERAFDAMASKEKKLVWLERSNHHIFWDYDAELVNGEVVAFLRRISERDLTADFAD